MLLSIIAKVSLLLVLAAEYKPVLGGNCKSTPRSRLCVEESLEAGNPEFLPEDALRMEVIQNCGKRVFDKLMEHSHDNDAAPAWIWKAMRERLHAEECLQSLEAFCGRRTELGLPRTMRPGVLGVGPKSRFPCSKRLQLLRML
jgi:hypothetical protein